MKQDKDTLQALLDKLSFQEQGLRAVLDQKIKSLETLQNEIEQQKGAVSYNIIIANEIREQLKILAAEAEGAAPAKSPQ